MTGFWAMLLRARALLGHWKLQLYSKSTRCSTGFTAFLSDSPRKAPSSSARTKLCKTSTFFPVWKRKKQANTHVHTCLFKDEVYTTCTPQSKSFWWVIDFFYNIRGFGWLENEYIPPPHPPPLASFHLLSNKKKLSCTLRYIVSCCTLPG